MQIRDVSQLVDFLQTNPAPLSIIETTPEISSAIARVIFNNTLELLNATDVHISMLLARVFVRITNQSFLTRNKVEITRISLFQKISTFHPSLLREAIEYDDTILLRDLIEHKEEKSGLTEEELRSISLLERNFEALHPVVQIKGMTKEQLSLVIGKWPKEVKENVTAMRRAASQNGQILEFLNSSLQSDPELVSNAVISHGLALRYAAADLKKRRDIVAFAVNQNGEALFLADPSFCKDPDLALAAVKKGVSLEKFLHFSGREDFVLAAILKNGFQLKYASNACKQNRDLVKTAVENDAGALKYAAKELQEETEILLAAVQGGLRLNRDRSHPRNNNRELVSAIIHEEPLQLEFVGEALSDDENIVKAAIKGDMRAFQYAGETQRNNIAFARYIRRNEAAFSAIGNKLKSNEAFMFESVKENGFLLFYGSKEIKNHKAIVLAASRQDRRALDHASRALKQDVAFMKKILTEHGRSIEYLDKKIRKNFDLALIALKNDPEAFDLVDPDLQKMKEIAAYNPRMPAPPQRSKTSHLTLPKIISDTSAALPKKNPSITISTIQLAPPEARAATRSGSSSFAAPVQRSRSSKLHLQAKPMTPPTRLRLPGL